MVSERERAERVAAAFTRTAEVLERSAGLAEEHADRCARLGRDDKAVGERQAAERARDGAQRARVRATDRLELLRELDERERLASERDRRDDERERVADDRDRAADERELVADERERAADALEARRYDDRDLKSGGALHRSHEALRQADEALAYARAGLRRLAAERRAPGEEPSR
jgi:hypothetical protein